MYRSEYMLRCNLLSPVADRGDDVSPGRVPLEISGLCVLGISDESELTGVIELQLTIHPVRVIVQCTCMHRQTVHNNKYFAAHTNNLVLFYQGEYVSRIPTPSLPCPQAIPNFAVEYWG